MPFFVVQVYSLTCTEKKKKKNDVLDEAVFLL